MAIKCKQDIIKLEITIDDTILVEVLDSQANFGSIEPEVVDVSRIPFSRTLSASDSGEIKLTEHVSNQIDHAEYATSNHHQRRTP